MLTQQTITFDSSKKDLSVAPVRFDQKHCHHSLTSPQNSKKCLISVPKTEISREPDMKKNFRYHFLHLRFEPDLNIVFIFAFGIFFFQKVKGSGLALFKVILERHSGPEMTPLQKVRDWQTPFFVNLGHI